MQCYPGLLIRGQESVYLLIHLVDKDFLILTIFLVRSFGLAISEWIRLSCLEAILSGTGQGSFLKPPYPPLPHDLRWLSIRVGDGRLEVIHRPVRQLQNVHSWPASESGAWMARGEERLALPLTQVVTEILLH